MCMCMCCLRLGLLLQCCHTKVWCCITLVKRLRKLHNSQHFDVNMTVVIQITSYPNVKCIWLFRNSATIVSIAIGSLICHNYLLDLTYI